MTRSHGRKLRAGAGSIDITPTESTFMPGFGEPDSRPSQGVYEKLHLTALVLDDGTRRAAILGADFLGWSDYMTDEIRCRLKKSCGLRPGEIFLNASHTHCGPKTTDESVPPRCTAIRPNCAKNGRHGLGTTEKPTPYVTSVLERTVELVASCFARAEKARLYFGRGRCDMACNRRIPNRHGDAHWGMNIFGAADHDVPVLKVARADGTTLAVLMNYACHTTTIGGSLVGPDYAGYARSFIETRFPSSTAVFLQGCGADTKPGRQDPKKPGQFDYSGGARAARAMGEKLGRAVLDVLTGEMAEIKGPIVGRCKALELPLIDIIPAGSRNARPFERPERRIARLAKSMLGSMDRSGRYRKTFPAEAQTIQIGDDFVLVGLSSEVCAGIGLDIKARLYPRPAIVCGYTNRYYGPYSGYIPSRSMIEEGGYEASIPFSPEMPDLLVGQAIELCGGSTWRDRRA